MNILANSLDADEDVPPPELHRRQSSYTSQYHDSRKRRLLIHQTLINTNMTIHMIQTNFNNFNMEAKLSKAYKADVTYVYVDYTATL